jgi:hypothetical protein
MNTFKNNFIRAQQMFTNSPNSSRPQPTVIRNYSTPVEPAKEEQPVEIPPIVEEKKTEETPKTTTTATTKTQTK